jgi:DNA repair exonuclease SbcCD ATPase subunit
MRKITCPAQMTCCFSLRGEIAKLKEEVSEEKRLHQKLKEKYTTATKDLNARLQQQREKVVQYERELQTMKNTVASLKEDKQKLTDNLKKMTQAPCHRPQCKQKIEQLQRDLNKLKPMEVMYHQHDGQNEQLSRDYDELMKAGRGDSVLHLLEKQFNDPFDAKQVLSSLFVGAYGHSKEYLFRCLHEQLDQLYVVQEDEAKHAELENLSSAFGLLLHHTGARTQLKPPAVQYVRKQLKEILPTLEPYSRAKRNLAEVELPLDKVAEVAWKFVTVPNPVIVMELEHYYGEEFQTRQYGKWKDGCEDYTLVYGRPLVYRSYHGIVMHTALVGQKTK